MYRTLVVLACLVVGASSITPRKTKDMCVDDEGNAVECAETVAPSPRPPSIQEQYEAGIAQARRLKNLGEDDRKPSHSRRKKEERRARQARTPRGN